MPDGAPGIVESDAPVDANNCAACRRLLWHKGWVSGGEVNDGHSWRQTFDNGFQMRQHEPPVIVRSEASHPAIENLDRVRAGGDLPIQVASNGAGKPAHQ